MAVRDGGSARKPGAGLITESDVEPGRPAAGSPITRWRLVACSTGLRCTEQRVLTGPRLAGRRKAGVSSPASSRTGHPSMSGTPARSAAAWPSWLSPVPVTTTAAGTSGCRVRMVTHAASSAVITWRHDGIGTRRLHRPPFSNSPPRRWRTESQRRATLDAVGRIWGPSAQVQPPLPADPGTTAGLRAEVSPACRLPAGYRALVAACRAV
jgi:hypothetical protein